MVGDALIKALPDVSVVFIRSGFTVVDGLAALWSTAVCDARANVLVVTVCDREFIVELMIKTEQPSPHIDLVVIVGTSAKAVWQNRSILDHRRHVGFGNIGHN